MKRFVLAAGALAALVAFSGCASQARGDEAAAAASDPGGASDRPAITATGVGEVSGKPDMLTVVLGVETRAPSANKALADNNQKATDLIDALKGRGVDEKDLQTSGLSIYPTHDDKGQRIIGYQVQNSVTAKLRDLGGAGELIDAAAAAAGDAVRVHQIGFSIDDDSALRATARADAVRRAKAQAEQMADAAGVGLGRVRYISESTSGGGPQPYPVPARAPGAAEDGAALAAPVEPGTQELTVTVTAVYDIE
ncbi:MAG: SIMPL domain-containing protein [Acidimicrobiia bacterium]